MQFVKAVWGDSDISEYYRYCDTLTGDKKSCEFETKVVNTALKCYGKTSFKAKPIAKEILKGNYISFLDNITIKTHLDSLVCAYIINKIKDDKTFYEYLEKFSLTVDNWASCDTLCFKRKNLSNLYECAIKFLKSEKPFVRRIGLNVFFELVKFPEYVDKVFKVIDGLKGEQEYYVNMCASWLLSVCMVYERDKTINYIKQNGTNAFIINKSIQKCRESFRVSKEDKDLLLTYKISK